MKQGNWLVLARTKFMLNDLEESLILTGVVLSRTSTKQIKEQDLYKASY